MGDVLRFPAPTPQPTPSRTTEPAAPLWREAVGHELRTERLGQERTLADVAGDAGVSTQYLSEVERGLKDPSSEMLQAIAGALDLTVRQLATRVSGSGGDVLALAA